MKASELVKALSEMIEECGDLPVYLMTEPKQRPTKADAIIVHKDTMTIASEDV